MSSGCGEMSNYLRKQIFTCHRDVYYSNVNHLLAGCVAASSAIGGFLDTRTPDYVLKLKKSPVNVHFCNVQEFTR